MTPVCSKCKYLTDQSVRFRKCARIPIYHPDMLCCNEKNMVRDNVTGENYTPYCEEVNRHAECLEYFPKGLDKPAITFFDVDDTLAVYGDSPFVITYDGTEPNSKMEAVGEYDDEQKVYVYETVLEHSCIVKAACVLDDVISEIVEYKVEIADVPVITFDKTTNTVTITSYNEVRYTTDGTSVTDESPLYEEPFVIDHNLTVKCRSFYKDEYSEEVSLECISVEPPVITFDADTNTVTITADDTILYSTDGSDIYDDSDQYSAPFVIDRNTIVKAACIVDGELSEQAEKECKVPSTPVISFDSRTATVTITSENPVLYTTDGSDVKKKDEEYKGPFKITQTTTIKAKSIVDDKLSAQAERECVI